MNAIDKLSFHPIFRESIFYHKRKNGKVQCALCERRCIINEDQKGFCKTRINLSGRLYTLVNGNISGIESRPIEIKPFYHYWPGSTALTFSTWSCNFGCPWCQNWRISKAEPDLEKYSYYSPEELTFLALKSNDNGLCASFQEPTLLTDWALDVFNSGMKHGLYCCYVSNGYITLEALQALKSAGMDGFKVDVKGDRETYRNYCGDLDVEFVWRNIHAALKMDIHVEVVNLIITGINDDEACLKWVIEKHLKDAGADVPLHFTRYHPEYNLSNPPTKIETLESAHSLAREAGVLFPYIRNLPEHDKENTYCPTCNSLLIERRSHRVISYNLRDDNKCPKCGFRIPLTGKFIKRLII